MTTTPYLFLPGFLQGDVVDSYLKLVDSKKEKDSKVGSKVNMKNKIRKDVFFSLQESVIIDEHVFQNLQPLVKENLGVELSYRETYKVGTYYGENGGFYTPHTDRQGGMDYRKISCVLCLSRKEDYDGGIFHFADLKKEFKFDKGDAIVFDSNLLHGVKPVTSGKRQIIATFMWNEENKNMYNKINASYVPRFSANKAIKKYMLPITPDSGPGNQIISIKEAILLSKLLNRTCILPPIHSHYTSTKKVLWNFDEIYDVKSDVCTYYDDSKKQEFSNIYGCHGKYTFENLKLEKILDIKDKKTILLKRRDFRTLDSISELKNLDDNTICIKHLWNHVKFNNCSINGCSNCDYNKIFLKDYKHICTLLDFSLNIKTKGNSFIEENLNNNFIAIHIRYPDCFPKHKTLKDCANYDEYQIFTAIEKLKKEKNIASVFVCTNNQSIVSNTVLKDYYLYNIDPSNPINSFIEQYICCRSNYFILSRYNDYSKLQETHVRSTWSSFVYDYRVLKDNNNNNIYLDKLLQDSNEIHSMNNLDWQPFPSKNKTNLFSTVGSRGPCVSFHNQCSWSIGIRWKNTIYGDPNILPDIIFVACFRFQFFFKHIYPHIPSNHKYVLIIADEDSTVPNQIDHRWPSNHVTTSEQWSHLVNNDNIKHIFVSHLDIEATHRYSPIPVGFNPSEFPSNNPDELLNIEVDLDIGKRPLQVLQCCRLHKGRNDQSKDKAFGYTQQFHERVLVKELIETVWKEFCEYKPINTTRFFKDIQKYSFILCIHGGGLEPNPKVFSAIYCGTIPIVKRFVNCEMLYKDLPVVFVDDWNPETITFDKLQQWRDERLSYFSDTSKRALSIEKLTTDYWLRYIYQKSNN